MLNTTTEMVDGGARSNIVAELFTFAVRPERVLNEVERRVEGFIEKVKFVRSERPFDAFFDSCLAQKLLRATIHYPHLFKMQYISTAPSSVCKPLHITFKPGAPSLFLPKKPPILASIKIASRNVGGLLGSIFVLLK